MTVSYYDLLDVDRSASADEIRTAWRAAVADLDPTDRRFRALSRAGQVLLDPQRRREYDDRLAAEEAAEAADEAGHESAAEPAEPTGDPDARPARADRPVGWVPPAWLIALVAALAVALVAAAGWLGSRPSADGIEASAREAQAAAEEAVGPILDYDGTDLKASQERARDYLTSDYSDEYDRFFEGVVEPNAPDLGTRISTQVLASGLVRASDDRAEVVVFIDRTTTSRNKPRGEVFRDQVTLTMERVDGRWLVDAMCTDQEQC